MSVEEKIRQRLEANPAIQEILVELHQSEVEARIRAAEKDPERHKTTRAMERGKNATYRYWDAGRDSKGREVRFCYTCWRNAAGYFLTFREVWDPATKTGFRDTWVPNKMRKRAAALAERWAREARAEAETRDGG